MPILLSLFLLFMKTSPFRSMLFVALLTPLLCFVLPHAALSATDDSQTPESTVTPAATGNEGAAKVYVLPHILERKMKDIIIDGISACKMENLNADQATLRTCLKTKIITFVKERSLKRRELQVGCRQKNVAANTASMQDCVLKAIADERSGVPYEATKTSSSTTLEQFAGCITAAKAVFYGADWCPHCQNQKTLFGDAIKTVKYIECDQNSEACNEQQITGYPTWIIDNTTRLIGTQSLASLGKATGCTVPSIATASAE